ncbi:hypothetical protein LCGC14_2898260 [marine sediment metagenome]|uniref:Fork-head domain-containing protein n=1 Tax=marine sediment metagenome TaxID=412755 RepID=A0A0F9A334_9ZZZZ
MTQRKYKELYVGQEVAIKRGNGRILALNRYPYPGDARPYVCIGSEDRHSWMDYVRHSELYDCTPQFPRDESHYCQKPNCGQHWALHGDLPERRCPVEDDTASDYDMFDSGYDLPRPSGHFWECLDNG